MKPFLWLLKQLHTYAGFRLYVNVIAMTLVEIVNGVGLLMLIPMLHYIGLSSLNIDNIPLISPAVDILQQLTGPVNLTIILAFYLLLTVGQSLFQQQQALFDARIQQGFMGQLRVKTYQLLLHADWTFYLKGRRSDYHHIMTTELGRAGQGVSIALSLMSAAIFTGIQIAIAFAASAKLTALVLIGGLALMLFSRRSVLKARRIGGQTTELWQSYFAGVTDQLGGMKDIKSNRLEAVHLNWFQQLSRQMENNSIRFKKLQMNTQLLFNTVSALLLVSFIYVSVQLLHSGIEQLMLVVLVFTRLWPRFMSIQSNVQQLVSVLPAVHRLNMLQLECEKAKESLPHMNADDCTPLPIRRSIECRDVSFRYDQDVSDYALQRIQLTIPANETTAVVGKSGAGKSTLIDLVIGLLRPEQGDIAVDGIPITEQNVSALRKSVSYVPQEPFLFNASIRDNLLMLKPDASEEMLWEALRFSAADEFVNHLPDGIDTIIGDRGTRLSGGERQRIVLARAILKKPSILVLDEATSSLDNENEAHIQAALDRLKGTMTIIIIAHRLSTIRNADQVVVLEGGRIVQQGGYQQLCRDAAGPFKLLLDYQLEPGSVAQ
ncbi:ABC transporter ATP-binding protein [Paenibacillus xylaniclasticus]|uniref:ABC transporter ATP-binding protein n=1 Tax=Paenibacillus xylaniclasticus TaxID=588083 RepID=UPI000FD863BE|nr:MULTISPECIES: ABC transporter ATP-binding protein [Paenibacillus]GFN31058.1 ABC transporter ATP-binding protein [Paenibacillus curdlanolyticus]